MANKRIFLRFIAVIIAAVMLSAAAAVSAVRFEDDGTIGVQYIEAVMGMAERNVINGFPDGLFRPENNLSREQGAKIIAYIVLGDRADRLYCETAPFSDVEYERWSAPCIAWCVGEEILLGYGNGKYGPADNLTGDQFAKMLLCALKLAREGNYVGLGDSWYQAVREDAAAAGLYSGDAGMATSQPITRQQASLLAWNAVKAAERAAEDTGDETPKPQETGSIPEGPGDGPVVPGTSGSSGPVEPGGTGHEDPPDTTPQDTGETGGNNPGGASTNSNGDILLPEVP